MRRDGVAHIPEYDGSVSFENVFFSYPSREAQQALVDFSLEITRGEVVAFAN